MKLLNSFNIFQKLNRNSGSIYIYKTLQIYKLVEYSSLKAFADISKNKSRYFNVHCDLQSHVYLFAK